MIKSVLSQVLKAKQMSPLGDGSGGEVILDARVSLFNGFDLSVAGGAVKPGTADMLNGLDLTVAGNAVKPGAVDMLNGLDLTVAGSAVKPGAVDMLNGLDLTVTGEKTTPGSIVLPDNMVALYTADSYVSGQTWANEIETPADGASQTDYDLYLGATSGASTDDPTFVSGPPKRFSHDGGDQFKLISSNPSLAANAHKTTGGADSFWVWCGRLGDTSTLQALMGTYSANASERDGLYFGNFNGDITLRQYSGGTISLVNPNHTIPADTWVCIGVSWPAGGGTARTWVSTESLTATETTHTFEAGTTDAGGKFIISGIDDNSGLRLVNGSDTAGALIAGIHANDSDFLKAVEYFESITGEGMQPA